MEPKQEKVTTKLKLNQRRRRRGFCCFFYFFTKGNEGEGGREKGDGLARVTFSKRTIWIRKDNAAVERDFPFVVWSTIQIVVVAVVVGKSMQSVAVCGISNKRHQTSPSRCRCCCISVDSDIIIVTTTTRNYSNNNNNNINAKSLGNIKVFLNADI